MGVKLKLRENPECLLFQLFLYFLRGDSARPLYRNRNSRTTLTSFKFIFCANHVYNFPRDNQTFIDLYCRVIYFRLKNIKVLKSTTEHSLSTFFSTGRRIRYSFYAEKQSKVYLQRHDGSGRGAKRWNYGLKLPTIM